MLLVGTIQNLMTTPKTVVFNFNSLNMNYEMTRIFPPKDLGFRSDYEFDMKYANYLLTNDEVFFEFMKIPYNVYLGNDVFILIDNSEEFEMAVESLLKFLQQRYGLNATYITDEEDFLKAPEVQFNELGAINFHNDKERLTMMLEKQRLVAGGYVGGVV